MKKLSRILLCVILMVALGTGCAVAPVAPTVEPEPETTAATEWVLDMTVEPRRYEGVSLTFLAMWEETSPEAKVLTQAAEVFEFETGAKVEIFWPQDGKDQGDIFQLPGGAVADRLDQLLDLTELAETAGYGEKSYPRLSAQVVERYGHLAAIPQIPYVTGFYYNRETFQTSGVIQSPTNWADFRVVCEMLTAGGWLPVTLNSELMDEMLMMHLSQYLGAEEAQRIAAEGGWKSEKAAAAAADLWDFASTGQVGFSGQNKVTLSNAAITYGTNALCRQAEEAALVDLEWGMFPYPEVDGGEQVIGVDADVLAISGDCINPQAAFDFIMLLVTGEFDQLRADLTVGIPADPENISPIAGADQALNLTQVVDPIKVQWTEKQLEVIKKLWTGKYQESDGFSKAMDTFYP